MVKGTRLEIGRTPLKRSVGSNPTPSAIRRARQAGLAHGRPWAGAANALSVVEGLLRMVFVVYIIECRDGTLYVGHTHDLSQRIDYHRKGLGSLHMVQRGFRGLLYQEELPDQASAVRRESQLKGWSRAKKLALAGGDFTRLKALSRSRA